MNKYHGIPELLEAYMEEHGADERWITAHELRDRFGLTRYQSNTFGTYPFIVAKIEWPEGDTPSDPRKSRYLLKLRGCSNARDR